MTSRFFRWRHPTFRQVLLLSMLLVALLPSLALLRSLLLLDTQVSSNRLLTRRAVQVTEDVQQLLMQGVALERSARQYLLLDDASLLQNYRAQWLESQQRAQRLLQPLEGAAHQSLQHWLQLGRLVYANLPAASGHPERVRPLLTLLQQMDETMQAVSRTSQQALALRQQQQDQQLDRERQQLLVWIAAALLGVILLAGSLGRWLNRPVRQLERAIHQLGEGRLTEPVQLQGPRDLLQLGQRLDWLRQRLAALEDDQARVLRHVSHELKTPLASLREGSALLAEDGVGELSAAQREVVSILQQNTLLLQRRIEDLLQLQAAATRHDPLRRGVSLQVALEAALQRHALPLQARQLRVKLTVPDVQLALDEARFAMLWDNLLSNAIRFSPPGGLIRIVGTRLQQEGRSWLQLDCIDQGPGVDPQDHARIFDPFFQGQRQPLDRATDAGRGSGVGLSIVRECVLLHGGRVRLLASAQGAHFRIELPDDHDSEP